MSGRVRVTLADGRRVTGFRKTLRRVEHRRSPGEMPPYRITVLLPERWLVAPGDTGIAGVTVEPDDISGELAIIENRDLEWALRQMARFLLSVATGTDRIMTAQVARDGVTKAQQFELTPEGASLPQTSKGTLWVAA